MKRKASAVAPSTAPGETGSVPAASMPDTESRDDSRIAVLFGALYSDLHRLARSQLARSGRPVALGPTTLLHETYLAMSVRVAAFPDRARFMAYAARVMRGLIIDHVRSRTAQKRGGHLELVPSGDDIEAPAEPGGELARLGEAIDELAGFDAELASTVELKFFCGFSFGEIASMRGVSERTVQRHWEKARIYLHRVLRQAQAPLLRSPGGG